MLYLHCGWPRTGTKSLQAALIRHQDRLANAGIVYPDLWQGQWGSADRSHNGLFELLKDSDASFDEFSGFLNAYIDKDVLISSEAFTVLLQGREDQETFLKFLAAARETMPVTCIWTLRRFDDFRCSFYLWLTSVGYQLRSPIEFMSGAHGSNLFTGMRQVEDEVDDVTYAKYDPNGGHNVELLRAFDLPAEVVGVLEQALVDSPRLNPSMSHKQAVAMLNVEVLSARSGFSLDKRALRGLFDGGDFQFEDDHPCDLVDDHVKRNLREGALESAVRCGFAPYVRFFGEEQAEENDSLPQVNMDPEVLSDEDLDRLVAHLQ